MTGPERTALIVLRGNSTPGKNTTAVAAHQRYGQRITVIEGDAALGQAADRGDQGPGPDPDREVVRDGPRHPHE